MIPATIVGLSLLVGVAIDQQAPDRLGTGGAEAPAHMSMQQKNAAVRPLVRSATECVARSISASPRYDAHHADDDINDLIVDSMTSCLDAMRAMIDAYDRYYGMGSGEVFFAGPYLDVLPTAVHKLLTQDDK
jgi:hypothetical protein